MTKPGSLSPRNRRGITPLLRVLVATGIVAAPAGGQPIPLTGDFMVPATTEEGQLEPDVAADGADNFRFTWREGTANGETLDDVRTRRLAADGSFGPEAPLAESTAGNQYGPRIAMTPAGDWSAIWYDAAIGVSDLFGRSTTAGGTLLGAQFPYDTGTGGGGPYAVAAVGEEYLVASFRATVEGEKLARANLRSRAGVNFGDLDVGPASVNSQTGVAGLGDIGWVAVWEQGDPPQEYGEVWARTYSFDDPLDSGFPIHPAVDATQEDPAIASNGDRDFVVVWVAQTEVGPVLFARLFHFYDELGAVPVSESIEIGGGPLTTFDPRVAMAADGAFVVVWRSLVFEPATTGIAAREFSRTGAPIGDAFPVNVVTTGGQMTPAVAVSANDFVVTWWTNEAGDEYDVKARRFRRRALFADDFEHADTEHWSAGLN